MAAASCIGCRDRAVDDIELDEAERVESASDQQPGTAVTVGIVEVERLRKILLQVDVTDPHGTVPFGRLESGERGR
ncbi:MAG: hypothetical protein U5N21_17175 [Rhodococcus sp. (in: high G+C Gram-positive bacteria)]|nr:hypothetical protein [Rhodococcus sp. (in: high G+C Gram-positive bacteria)]